MPGTPEPGAGLTRTYDLLSALADDVATSYKLLDQQRDSQYLRRCAVRSVYSYIEACVECIKVELRSSIRLGHFTGGLSASEEETLGTLSVIAPRSGKFLPLDKNIKRTFRLAAKVWAIDFELDVTSDQAKSFAPSKSARNRLTHPYTFYDIEASDDDMSLHTSTFIWMRHEFGRLFRARVESLRAGLPESDQQAFRDLLD